jgi:hypothetical protein
LTWYLEGAVYIHEIILPLTHNPFATTAEAFQRGRANALSVAQLIREHSDSYPGLDVAANYLESNMQNGLTLVDSLTEVESLREVAPQEAAYLGSDQGRQELLQLRADAVQSSAQTSIRAIGFEYQFIWTILRSTRSVRDLSIDRAAALLLRYLNGR